MGFPGAMRSLRGERKVYSLVNNNLIMEGRGYRGLNAEVASGSIHVLRIRECIFESWVRKEEIREVNAFSYGISG